MRIRIVQKPTTDSIDGLQLDRYELGYTYDVGNTTGMLLLAEGWGEPADEVVEIIPPIDVAKAEAPVAFDPDNPPNLRREVYPPYLDRLDLDLAADLARLRRAGRMTESSDGNNGKRSGPRRGRDPRVK